MKYRIYGDIQSGNCYKIKLLAHHLKFEHEWIHVDILAGETHTSDFLNKNPVGKIPVLEFPDGYCLSESNAVLHYLAEGTPWLPTSRLRHAEVLQ